MFFKDVSSKITLCLYNLEILRRIIISISHLLLILLVNETRNCNCILFFEFIVQRVFLMFFLGHIREGGMLRRKKCEHISNGLALNCLTFHTSLINTICLRLTRPSLTSEACFLTGRSQINK